MANAASAHPVGLTKSEGTLSAAAGYTDDGGPTPHPAMIDHGKSRLIEGKDPRLEALSAAPLVLSTPIELMKGQRIIGKTDCSSATSRTWQRRHTLDPGRSTAGRSN